LNIEDQKQLERSPFYGAIFEGYVASEIIKDQVNHGRQRQLYYFRDQQGLEVDFVVPFKNNELHLIEVKASKTVTPRMVINMDRLSKNITKQKLKKYVIYCEPNNKSSISTNVLSVGVSAVTLKEYLHCVPSK
jgi:predicted AAA+ superfamily ATPase